MKKINKKKKIALLFPAFLGGGAEAVCVEILCGLQHLYDLDLITLSYVKIGALNEKYNAKVAEEKINQLVVPLIWPLKKIIINPKLFYTLRHCIIQRYFKKYLQQNYDLAFSAFNEMDLGRPGIQYIHFPIFGLDHERAREIAGYPDDIFRRLSRIISNYYSHYSQESMLNNYTIVNSQWTGNIVKEVYDIPSIVIYPPIHDGEKSTSPWNRRENSFLLVSRIVPEKRIEIAIEILNEVRKRGHLVNLHIAGEVADKRYYKRLLNLADYNQWIRWETNLTRESYHQLLASIKFGIHAKDNEPFGIGIAEMVAAGCLPFVPVGGGQVEAIGGITELIWKDKTDAVTKISSVISDITLQRKLLNELLIVKKEFCVANFRDKLADVVELAIKRQSI